MDPLSALSIAAAVVQFLDFGAKLVGTSLEVYRSAEGATEQNLETEYLVEHTRDLTARLKSAQQWRGSKDLKHDDAKLLDLAQKSHSLASDLAGLVISLRSHNHHTSWDAIKQTIRIKYSEHTITSLKARLDAVKCELSLQLLCMIRSVRSRLHIAQRYSLTFQQQQARCI